MQSRMDKYNTTDLPVSSRLSKNQSLYEDVKNSSMNEYDIKSNVAVLDEKADKINVEHVKKILDRRYSADAPKRKSITLPEEKEEPIIEETTETTKEYDINAILERTKRGENVDYSRERLKKVRETQYEILNNLDLNKLSSEDNRIEDEKKQEEKNLMNLINTITELETEFKTAKLNKETRDALDLLSDLKDDPKEEVKEEVKTDEKIETPMTKQESLEKTLDKLDVKQSDYSEFDDISKTEASSIIIKIILIIIIIALVVGGIYILDNILSLGLF